MNFLYEIIEPLQGFVFENVILPMLHKFAMTGYADEVFDATGDVLLGVLSIVITYPLLRPLEIFRPVEHWHDRKAVRDDVFYTFLMRCGLLPISFFLILDPLITPIESQLHMAGVFSIHLEEMIPWLKTWPWIAFLAYMIVIDFFEYVRHRFSHRYNWWWGLHSIHHSQRQLNLWSDERNHVLDSFIKAIWLAVIAIIIGVPGGQFLPIVLFMKFVESLSHTNVRLNFGRFFSKILVSPAYHRMHHGIGVGHEGKYFGCNFAALFPVWDIIFRTANFDTKLPATGIRDQQEGVNYGEGFIEQQLVGFKKMFAALMPVKS